MRPTDPANFSSLVDSNLTFRVRELSDLKQAIREANPLSRDVLLKALVAICYSHWEGFVKYSADLYFEYVAMRRMLYTALKPSFYANAFLIRLGSFLQNKPSVEERLSLIHEIRDPEQGRFTFINKDLINTGSNLNSENFKNICLVCDIDYASFKAEEDFINVILLKRRNAIAHGDHATVRLDEIDDLVFKCTGLMRSFKNELENKVYNRGYAA